MNLPFPRLWIPKSSMHPHYELALTLFGDLTGLADADNGLLTRIRPA
jgi:hypothetical protein